MTSGRELEKKYRVNCPVSDVIAYLHDRGWKHRSDRRETDVYWDTDSWKLLNLKRGLRTRFVDNRLTAVEFKSLFMNGRGQFVIEEIQFLERNRWRLRNLLQILADAGAEGDLVEVATITKQRTEYQNGSGECLACIDEIEGQPLFIEVEMIRGSEREFCRIARDFERHLRLDATQDSYIDIVLRHDDRLLSVDEFSRRFLHDRQWNVSPREAGRVQRLLDGP